MARTGTLLWLAIAAASLWIRAGFPLVALGGAGADDALFIRLARSLALGQWLGPYDNLTLAKGMFYPLFIAAVSFTAIPLKMAEQAVYLAVCAATAAYAGRRSRPWVGTVLFATLAFNPVFWDRQLARVIREGLYDSLCVAVVALACAAAFSPTRPLRRASLGVALGLVTAAFWLTREEGVWILPALATILLLALAGLAAGPARWRRLASLGLPFVLAGLVFAAANGAVALQNGRAYGNAVTTEFKADSFQQAYGALAGIRQDQWRRYVVFPRDARLRAYAVSPAARELQPFFEGPGGEIWRRIGCEQTGTARAACPDILAGWFMWALRDAVTSAGHAHSAGEARAFYRRVAREVDAACGDGRLACVGSHRATLAPPFRWRYLGDAWKRAGKVATIVLTAGGGNMDTPPSEGWQPDLDKFADLAGPYAPYTGPVTQHVTGWAAAAGGTPTLATDAGAAVTDTVLNARSGADVEASFPGLHAMRFGLTSSCMPESCALVMSAPGTPPVALPWASLRRGDVIATPTERLFVDDLSSFDSSPVSGERMRLQRWCAAELYRLYRYAIPVFAGLGVLGLAIAAVRRRGPSLAVAALATASLVAILCRIALLAYLDVTSIPSANALYASPASAFVILLAVLGTHAGLSALRRRRSPDVLTFP